MRVIVSGGGTGGHITPLYAVIQELREENPRVEILWIGSKIGPEKDFAQRHNIPYEHIAAGKFRRYTPNGLDFGGDPSSIGQNFIDMFKVPIGIIQAYFRIADFMPDVIFSKGGYVSLPVVIAGKLLGVPTIIHESDVIPGLANRIASRFATVVLTGFTEAKKYFPIKSNVRFSGNPVRSEILNANREKAFSVFKFQPAKPVILVTGGSLGASRINQVVMGAIESILEIAQVIHLTGERDWVKIAPHAIRLERFGYRAYPNLTDNMAGALAIADLAITRAGANTLSEFAVLGKPMIIIPLGSGAGGHQEANAKIFTKHGAAIVINEEKFDGETLLRQIKELINSEEKLADLSKNAKNLAHPNAAAAITREITHLASHRSNAQLKTISRRA